MSSAVQHVTRRESCQPQKVAGTCRVLRSPQSPNVVPAPPCASISCDRQRKSESLHNSDQNKPSRTGKQTSPAAANPPYFCPRANLLFSKRRSISRRHLSLSPLLSPLPFHSRATQSRTYSRATESLLHSAVFRTRRARIDCRPRFKAGLSSFRAIEYLDRLPCIPSIVIPRAPQ